MTALESTRRAEVAWIDCRVGVAGDMLLAACLDAGADTAAVRRAIAAATGGAVTLATERVRRRSLAATAAHVLIADDAPQVHGRNLADILALLATDSLSTRVRVAAGEVFTTIAEVEAACHGVTIEQVHFHEVGAWDTIADIVGVLAAWESLGWPHAVASAVSVGSGVVNTAHGPLSVPAPAVASLLAHHGAPSQAGPLQMEATTPTGAALVGYLCAGNWAGQPPMRTLSVGYGAGSADPAAAANITRVFLGESSENAAARRLEHDGITEITELTCNVDDLDPRLWPSVLTSLFALGALDCWHADITMKHGRPARALSVLCAPEQVDTFRTAIFELTTTLGVRWQLLPRQALERRFVEVSVGGEAIAVKIGHRRGIVHTATPEWRDVERAAEKLHRPAREVLAEAQALARDTP